MEKISELVEVLLEHDQIDGSEPTSLLKLRHFACQNGGHIVITDYAFVCGMFKKDGWSTSIKDGIGLHKLARVILVAKGHEDLNGIIHEMGHLFAEAGDPEYHHEWEWIGWEIALARWAGCWDEWNSGNTDYGVGEVEDECLQPPIRHGRNWEDLSDHEREVVTENRLEAARNNGLLNMDDEPIAVV